MPKALYLLLFTAMSATFLHYISDFRKSQKRSLLTLLGIISLIASNAQDLTDSLPVAPPTIYQKNDNPAQWLHRGENMLFRAESRLFSGLDTGFLERALTRLVKDITLASKDFESHSNMMRTRDLDDAKARFLQQRDQLEKWRNGMRKANDSIAQDFVELEKLMADSQRNKIKSDSTLGLIYRADLLATDAQLNRVDQLYRVSLTRTVEIENILNKHIYHVNQMIIAVNKALKLRSATIYQQTHPPLWRLHADSYAEGIGPVFMNTIRQNLGSLEFYGKNAYIRAILFRVMLLLITLLPIWYFRKNKARFAQPDNNSPYKFVHKYTAASTSSFVMVMAPFIFINAPHIFLEAILAVLAVTTSSIFIRENPGVGRKNMYAILVVYILLKLMNTMVSVTLFGRIFWSLSIFGILPLLAIFRNIHLSQIKYKGMARVIIGLVALMYISGWILNVTGHYPLGRLLLLAGLDQFFLAVILYVAMFSFIDFIGILADLYNSSNKITTVRVDLIYRKLLALVRILAVIFWFWSLIQNLNLDEFIQHHTMQLLDQNIAIGRYRISPGSILIFFVILYLSFYLSSLLDGLFYDEKRSTESTSKTSLGSIVLILRLFILASGFIIGMIIAGIPLDSISLFFGALGVGIGFGLQGLIGNLISGIIVAFEKAVYVGDIIEVDGQRGRVTDIGLRATKVDTYDGAEYIIPNSSLTSQTTKNWTLTSKHFKLEQHIQVDLQNDASKVIASLEKALKEVPGILQTPPPVIRLEGISATALICSVSCWIHDIIKANSVKSELLRHIHQSLRDASIDFPKRSPNEHDS
jgi:potassium-dependent mechanosensitive channel